MAALVEAFAILGAARAMHRQALATGAEIAHLARHRHPLVHPLRQLPQRDQREDEGAGVEKRFEHVPAIGHKLFQSVKMLYMEPDPAVVRNLLTAVERRDEAARAYSTAMEDLAEALRAAHAAGGPVSHLAEVSRLSRPTIYRLLRTGGTGYERRLGGNGGERPQEP